MTDEPDAGSSSGEDSALHTLEGDEFAAKVSRLLSGLVGLLKGHRQGHNIGGASDSSHA